MTGLSSVTLLLPNHQPPPATLGPQRAIYLWSDRDEPVATTQDLHNQSKNYTDQINPYITLLYNRMTLKFQCKQFRISTMQRGAMHTIAMTTTQIISSEVKELLSSAVSVPWGRRSCLSVSWSTEPNGIQNHGSHFHDL